MSSLALRCRIKVQNKFTYEIVKFEGSAKCSGFYTTKLSRLERAQMSDSLFVFVAVVAAVDTGDR